MKQIIIIGCPGSGKTYFAKQLSEILQIELFHMDNIYWKKDKTHISREELVCRVDEMMSQSEWILDENFYFVRAERNDDFGQATIIETAGGGVEEGEELQDAVKRELKEELGVKVDVICKIGVVSDCYNLIHRHNINNYFLCKVESFGEKELTEDEINNFHLSTLKLSYEEVVREYDYRSNTRLGKLIANRELPVLHRAKEIIDI